MLPFAGSWLFSKIYSFIQMLTVRCLFLACCLPMAKTHLEHQYRRVKILGGKNNGTTTYSPYANYDPKEGLTTAIILGGSFLLLITYILAKVGWEKFKKRFCCRRPRQQAEILSSDIENQVLIPHIQEQSVPIVVRTTGVNGSLNTGLHKPDVSNLSPVKQNPTLTCSTTAANMRSSNKNQGDSYTMIVATEKSKGTERSRTKSRSRSTSESPEKSLHCKSSCPHILPPQVNQALRTAHWVNTISHETSFDTKPEEQSMANIEHITKAEINHNQSGAPSEDLQLENTSLVNEQYQIVATTEV